VVGFNLTEKQKDWQKKAHHFAQTIVRPLGLEMDRLPEHGEEWRARRKEYIDKAAAEGLFSLGIDEKYGGSGLDFLTMAVVIEELAVGDQGLAFTTAMNSSSPILLAGTDEQKAKFLPLVAGKNPGMFAFSLTEPGAGSDAGALATTARLDNEEYILNGTKCFISNGASAALYTIFATVDRSTGVKGITAFIVEGDRPGVSGGKIEDKIGFRTSETAEVILNDVRIPKDNLIGGEGGGFKIAMQFLDGARLLSAGAIGVGAARAAYEGVLEYFNRAQDPVKKAIGSQPIAFALAEIASAIEASRLLVWKACWLKDQGMPATLNAAWAKFYASDIAVEAANKAVQLIGQYGYGDKHPLEKFVRDAKVLQIYEGTNQIAKLVAARFIK
jgi:alkylation response protein AidB-like acyl-CoA dehydrogenase